MNHSILADCIICLIQQIEVFFVYTEQVTPFGYVWVRQAASNILQLCLVNHKTRLTYSEDRHHIERPTGLRQWTAHDAQARYSTRQKIYNRDLLLEHASMEKYAAFECRNDTIITISFSFATIELD